jgi:DNA-binding protein H-NS
VRFHEDQIELHESVIEKLQSAIIARRDQIDEHQQWLNEHVSQREVFPIELSLTDIQIIRSALDEHQLHPERPTYNALVKQVYRKIDELHTRSTWKTYPEMMKYPGKIRAPHGSGDYSGLT